MVSTLTAIGIANQITTAPSQPSFETLVTGISVAIAIIAILVNIVGFTIAIVTVVAIAIAIDIDIVIAIVVAVVSASTWWLTCLARDVQHPQTHDIWQWAATG